MTTEEEKPIKLFISYAHETEELSSLVLNLSTRLRSDGFDSSIDLYEDSPELGWPRWMEKQIGASDFVLVVCTQEYLKRLQDFEDVGGSGVKWETNLIYQHLYDSNSLNTRFIPIVFYEEDINYIPKPLKGSTYYRLFDDFDYRLLYCRLRGIKNIEKPDLGSLTPMPFKGKETLRSSNLIIKKDWDEARWRGIAHLRYPKLPWPVLGFVFDYEEPSRKIFSDWKVRFGDVDINNTIYISIIKTQNEEHEQRYIVLVGTNVFAETENKIINKQDADSSLLIFDERSIDIENIDNFQLLNQFERDFKQYGTYIIQPVLFDHSSHQIIPIPDLGIIKREISIKWDKEVLENDPDYFFLKRIRMAPNNHTPGVG